MPAAFVQSTTKRKLKRPCLKQASRGGPDPTPTRHNPTRPKQPSCEPRNQCLTLVGGTGHLTYGYPFLHSSSDRTGRRGPQKGEAQIRVPRRLAVLTLKSFKPMQMPVKPFFLLCKSTIRTRWGALAIGVHWRTCTSVGIGGYRLAIPPLSPASLRFSHEGFSTVIAIAILD